MTKGIYKLKTDSQLRECVAVLKDAFSTVVLKFGLTVQNCPSNTGFIDFGKLKHTTKQSVEYFGYYENGIMVGCIGLKEKEDRTFEIVKLGVLKKNRNKYIGKKLLDYSYSYIERKDGNKIVLGMIAEDGYLKKWYINQGFAVLNNKKFKHLPFTICFMEKKINRIV